MSPDPQDRHGSFAPLEVASARSLAGFPAADRPDWRSTAVQLLSVRSPWATSPTPRPGGLDQLRGLRLRGGPRPAVRGWHLRKIYGW